jgi:hypothetical protein
MHRTLTAYNSYLAYKFNQNQYPTALKVFKLNFEESDWISLLVASGFEEELGKAI